MSNDDGTVLSSSIKVSTPLPSPQESPNELAGSGPAQVSNTTTTSKPRPQKLRQSCDPCAASKVKCSKEQPACRRCINNGRECVYLPSMRSGRARWKRKKSRPAEEEIKPSDDFQASLANWSPQFSTEGSVSNESSSMDLDNNLPLDSIEIPMMEPHLDHGIYLPTPDTITPSLSTNNAFTFDPCLQQSPLDTSFNFDASTALDLPSADMNKLQFSSDLDFTNCLFEPDTLDDFAFAPAIPEDASIPESATSSATFKAVQAADLAFTTLSSLYACEKFQTRARAQSTPVAAYDAIIKENEKALATVDTLLESPSPHLASNLCFIILKILALYTSAARVEPRHAKSQSRPVLTGLRRVEKIVDNFSERLGLGDASGDAGHEMVFVQMERMMRKVLRKTISGSARGIA